MEMNRFNRFSRKEITVERVCKALSIRVREIPHAFSWSFSAEAQLNRDRILRYKDQHLGERCFIVANGPSLRQTNLDLLQGEYTFGLNRIYLGFEDFRFRPTYLVVMNELILDQCVDEISHLEMIKFLNWNRRSRYVDPQHNTVFLKSKMVLSDSFQVDLTRPVIVGATVTFAALQLAYFMGFTQAILVGLDHNYGTTGTPSKTEIRIDEHDADHFHKDYFPKGFAWQLPDLRRADLDFMLARRAFEAAGREIIDATVNGKCQVFRKVDFRSLFDSKKTG